MYVSFGLSGLILHIVVKNENCHGMQFSINPVLEYSLEYPYGMDAILWLKSEQAFYRVSSFREDYKEIITPIQVAATITGHLISALLNSRSTVSDAPIAVRIQKLSRLDFGEIFHRLTIHRSFALKQLRLQSKKLTKFPIVKALKSSKYSWGSYVDGILKLDLKKETDLSPQSPATGPPKQNVDDENASSDMDDRRKDTSNSKTLARKSITEIGKDQRANLLHPVNGRRSTPIAGVALKEEFPAHSRRHIEMPIIEKRNIGKGLNSFLPGDNVATLKENSESLIVGQSHRRLKSPPISIVTIPPKGLLRSASRPLQAANTQGSFEKKSCRKTGYSPAFPKKMIALPLPSNENPLFKCPFCPLIFTQFHSKYNLIQRVRNHVLLFHMPSNRKSSINTGTLWGEIFCLKKRKFAVTFPPWPVLDRDGVASISSVLAGTGGLPAPANNPKPWVLSDDLAQESLQPLNVSRAAQCIPSPTYKRRFKIPDKSIEFPKAINHDANTSGFLSREKRLKHNDYQNSQGRQVHPANSNLASTYKPSNDHFSRQLDKTWYRFPLDVEMSDNGLSGKRSTCTVCAEMLDPYAREDYCKSCLVEKHGAEIVRNPKY